MFVPGFITFVTFFFFNIIWKVLCNTLEGTGQKDTEIEVLQNLAGL